MCFATMVAKTLFPLSRSQRWTGAPDAIRNQLNKSLPPRPRFLEAGARDIFTPPELYVQSAASASSDRRFLCTEDNFLAWCCLRVSKECFQCLQTAVKLLACCSSRGLCNQLNFFTTVKLGGSYALWNCRVETTRLSGCEESVAFLEGKECDQRRSAAEPTRTLRVLRSGDNRGIGCIP